jgi:hypothetical protein
MARNRDRHAERERWNRKQERRRREHEAADSFRESEQLTAGSAASMLDMHVAAMRVLAEHVGNGLIQGIGMGFTLNDDIPKRTDAARREFQKQVGAASAKRRRHWNRLLVAFRACTVKIVTEKAWAEADDRLRALTLEHDVHPAVRDAPARLVALFRALADNAPPVSVMGTPAEQSSSLFVSLWSGSGSDEAPPNALTNPLFTDATLPFVDVATPEHPPVAAPRRIVEALAAMHEALGIGWLVLGVARAYAIDQGDQALARWIADDPLRYRRAVVYGVTVDDTIIVPGLTAWDYLEGDDDHGAEGRPEPDHSEP